MIFESYLRRGGVAAHSSSSTVSASRGSVDDQAQGLPSSDVIATEEIDRMPAAVSDRMVTSVTLAPIMGENKHNSFGELTRHT
jgi:hypothetical protein